MMTEAERWKFANDLVNDMDMEDLGPFIVDQIEAIPAGETALMQEWESIGVMVCWIICQPSAQARH